MRRWIAIAIATVILLAIAAVAAGQGTSPTDTRASRVLVLWRRFPVGVHPRPVIPINGIVSNPNDGPEDVALGEHQLKLQVALPDSPRMVGGYRLIGASSALHALRSYEKGGGPTASPTPLAIRAVVLGSARFGTDRGWTRLPAWKFYFRGFHQPAMVMAARPYPVPSVRRLVLSGSDSQPGGSAVLSGGGRRLTIEFVGGPAGNQPCDDSYTVTTIASDTAVVFTITTTSVTVPAGEACSDVGYRRTVVAGLPRPLGPRVLVDSTDGRAIPVSARPAWPF